MKEILNKKTRLVICAALLLLSIMVGFFVVNKFKNAQEPNLIPEQWAIYYNQKYSYKIEYPISYLSVSQTESSDEVSFNDRNSYLHLFIEAKTVDDNFNLIEWLEQNKQWYFENETKIDDYDAVVTHYVSDEGEFLDEKLTLFIKNGKLFSILSRYIDHDRILNSFRFE